MSSTASWSRAAAIVGASRPSSATIWATATGWVTYGSPDRRYCPAWASTAARPAATMAGGPPPARCEDSAITGSIRSPTHRARPSPRHRPRAASLDRSPSSAAANRARLTIPLRYPTGRKPLRSRDRSAPALALGSLAAALARPGRWPAGRGAAGPGRPPAATGRRPAGGAVAVTVAVAVADPVPFDGARVGAPVAGDWPGRIGPVGRPWPAGRAARAAPPAEAPTSGRGRRRQQAAPLAPDSSRCRMAMYRGSRSFSMASTGDAMKIDEYAPLSSPTNRARP